jgi:His-Xaa-Ser system radical SAM maturase HxsC
MIPLRGTARAPLATPLHRDLWVLAGGPVSADSGHAYLIDERPVVDGFDLYVAHDSTPVPDDLTTPVLRLPPELNHLSAGDIISVSPDGRRIRVAWRHASKQNSILLTERCDNYCLMCSQPPRDDDDSWMLDKAMELVRLLPSDTSDLIYTGGEPTLYGQRLLDLLALTLERLPDVQLHLLSNGRRFADEDFAAAYTAVGDPRLMVGIPLYGAEASLHDYVVQAPGAFDETIRGILNLAALNQPVEIRVVIHKQTVPALVEIAEFIARNLPFVDQVALMGLEMMGLARANLTDVWIDPWDYRNKLQEAAELLDAARIRTLIFNHQLCVLNEEIWHQAVPSISDWKNIYLPACNACDVRDQCGGLFHSSKYKRSDHIRPIRKVASIAATQRSTIESGQPGVYLTVRPSTVTTAALETV